jgi:hypothetical protein
MNKLERYRKLYPADDGIENMVINSNGKLTIPKWLICLVLHSSGLKSRKKRIVKKVLKKQVIKLIESSLDALQTNTN